MTSHLRPHHPGPRPQRSLLLPILLLCPSPLLCSCGDDQPNQTDPNQAGQGGQTGTPTSDSNQAGQPGNPTTSLPAETGLPCEISADCPKVLHCDLSHCVQRCNQENPCKKDQTCTPRCRCLDPNEADQDPAPQTTYAGQIALTPSLTQRTRADEALRIGSPRSGRSV